MGFFDAIGKLLSGEEVFFEKTTHVNLAGDLLKNRQNYIGEWRGANTNLLIKEDGTVEYRREEIIGDSTNTDTLSGPINAFDGAGFTVGVLGNNTHFQVDAPLADGSMTVNGERLERV